MALFQFPKLGVLHEIVVGSKAGDHETLHPIPESLFQPIGLDECRNGRTQELSPPAAFPLLPEVFCSQGCVTIERPEMFRDRLATVVE